MTLAHCVQPVTTVCCSNVNTDGSWCSVWPETAAFIFTYQSVSCLGTKFVFFCDNVCFSEYKILY
jgi:hypothetical protein